MNAAKAIFQFYNTFGLKVYDENSVPHDAAFPYMTYSLGFGGMNEPITLRMSIWYRSSSWNDADEKMLEISNRLGEGGTMRIYDDGAVWLCKGVPFAQRLGDEKDDLIKRYIFNISANFIGKD